VPNGREYTGRKIAAQTYNSGFADAHETFNGMGASSDGRIFYVLTSERHDLGAQMFCFDPKTKEISYLADLTEVCGEKGKHTIVQGKSHVNFVETNGKLYFATHLGFYSTVGGKEVAGIPPEGWGTYSGGHLLSYDLMSGKFEDFGIAIAGEGIITMNMDTRGGRIFGLTWPSCVFFRYNLATGDLKSFGKQSADGELGVGGTFRTVCRSIAVDPDEGSAYFTTSEGVIFKYFAASDRVAPIKGENLRKDYFGTFDPSVPGHMGFNWRQTFWRAQDKMIYGTHGNSGYLFRFDPRATRIDVLERLTSEPSRRSGMADQSNYGYLGLALGPDGQTVHFLTGGPIYVDGKRLAGSRKSATGEVRAPENLHLVTYDLEQQKYSDNGAIFNENGQRLRNVYSIAVGKDGMVYTLARFSESGKTRFDLVAFPGPLKK
jgi:hypothetical protein